MRIKKVYRYYCDFCKKSGGSKYHIREHEKHCTMNPNRQCGMCEYAGFTQKPMNELLAILPEMNEFTIDYGESGSLVIDSQKINNAVKELVEFTQGCPACIMAAIRQKGIFVSLTNYDYKEEVARFWQGNGARYKYDY
jgi:hypothetical protein